jgi:hypothetical protein
MSKRCELQKQYHKEYGNYKGDGKYSDHYVKWLESRILELSIPVVVKSVTDNYTPHTTTKEFNKDFGDFLSNQCQ